MSSPLDPTAAAAGVEWEADLTLEYEGRLAARLVSRAGRCVLEIASLAAFKSLASIWSQGKSALSGDWVQRLPSLLPPVLELVLHGVPIGRFEAGAPLNWAAKGLGLPFGNLALDKLALLRASLKGGA